MAEDATVVVADIGELTHRHTDITVEAEEITVTRIMTTASGVPREKDEESTAGRRRSPWAAG